MFLEQVFNPVENRPTPTKEEIESSFDNFYGKGERPQAFPDDMSGQYNTQLSPDEESAYQAWAKEHGREKDVFNYDLRGAWKELQSGTMSEDERGHLGDKYKKPNHPTFSTESIYNGKDGYQGGVWSREGNVDIYTPQHKLTPEQAKRLRLYFAQNEEGVALNLKDKVYDNPTIQLAPKSVGAFDGLAKGILYPIPNALVRMGSGALMVASKAMPWVRDDFLKQMEQASLDLDKWNRANFGANPEIMGKATQVIHGLVGMLAELGVLTTGVGGAAGLAIKGVGAAEKLRKTSIAVGSALFGTDIGISERNRLVAEGVDEDTAFKAGAVSGLLNTIGAAIPPFLGSSRTWSALYGAGSNVALNYAELSTISYVLDHQDYTELAKQYELNMVDMLVSAGVGAFMGTVFWRNPVDVKYDRAHQRVYERYKSDLEAGGKFSQEEIESQAKLNAAAAVSYARMAHIAPDQVDDMATKLVWTDDRKAFAVPDEYAMPITQGRKWLYGDNAIQNPDKMVRVIRIDEPKNKEGANNESLSALLRPYRGKVADSQLLNDETGWKFTITSNDAREIVHGISESSQNSVDRRANAAILRNLVTVVKNAFLAESYRDIKAQQGAKGKDVTLKGIHRFYAPVVVGNREYLTKITVKDRFGDGGKGISGKERLSAYQIVGLEIQEAQSVTRLRAPESLADVSAEARQSPNLEKPRTPNRKFIGDEISVRDMLTGVKRDGDVFYIQEVGTDGKIRWVKDETRRTRFFEGKPNKEALEENGGYWNSPDELPQVFYQLGYHGTPYLFDAFTLAHIGSGEGAQAHGWGLYFALNRRTAEDYARRLSSWIDDVQLFKLSRSLKKDREAASFFKRHLYKEREDALTTFWMNRYSLQAVDEAFKEGSITKQAYEWFNAEVRTKAKGAREMHLYTVDIPNDDVMLREEWKISKQNDAVKEAYRQYCKERFGLDSSDITTDYVNGYDFYRDLTEWQGGPKEASLWLNKHGVKGIRYNGYVDGECAVVWDEKSIKILEYLQKGQEGIRGAFNPSTNTIRLTPNANMSTFSHEHAHWYLTNTLALGGKEGAPLELQSQINAILHAFGLKSIDEWNALGFEGQRKYQEQFAAWTEIYLTQGKSPVKELEGVFAKMAEWLIGMYKAALGKDAGPDAAVREVSDRYQAQFGEKLPELSPEVRKVLDTMYGAQQKRSAFKSSKAQAMAGRLVQAQRVNQTKVSAPISDPHGPTAGNVGQAAQGKAVSDLNNGRKVDVSEQVGDTEANVPVVEDTQSTFARGVSIGDGDNSRVVVLQNRNRSDPNSVAQMNSIATDPQYGRLSTSRTTQSGAPIVSFGHLPDKAYQGKSEIITESNGNKVPVTYYVVEADDVMRSNNYDGTPNKEWNNDNPDQMRAIAGNGRMAGLSEAYNRGTAEQYRQDLMADSENHGVSPETIKGMKKPVLVRYMPPDRVTTGFVERSNTSDVLVRSSLETAVQDSPKVRKNIGKYEFDEDGDPTKETLGQFLTDVGEVSEMGNLIDSNGNPTTAARARIKAAVFYEAYRDKRLTELVADSEDKHGIKRILSAMSAFAPHVIQIRETSGGAIDLAPIITDATHRILQARINGEGVDFTAQGDMFSSNPATEMMTNFLSQNRNSAAAMLRVLRPFAEQVENALQVADSPMFADLAVKTDLADAMALFRKAENQEIRNRSGDLLGDADGKLLPEIDVEAMRSSLANTLKDGKNLVDAISEGVAVTNHMATPEAKAEAQQQHLIEQQNARDVLSENSEAVRARNFALEDPNRELVMTDEAGNDIVISAREAMAQADEIEKGLNDDTAGLGMGVACIIRNQGIR